MFADSAPLKNFLVTGVDMFTLSPDFWQSPTMFEYRKRLAVAVIQMMIDLRLKGAGNYVQRLYQVRAVDHFDIL